MCNTAGFFLSILSCRPWFLQNCREAIFTWENIRMQCTEKPMFNYWVLQGFIFLFSAISYDKWIRSHGNTNFPAPLSSSCLMFTVNGKNVLVIDFKTPYIPWLNDPIAVFMEKLCFLQKMNRIKDFYIPKLRPYVTISPDTFSHPRIPDMENFTDINVQTSSPPSIYPVPIWELIEFEFSTDGPYPKVEIRAHWVFMGNECWWPPNSNIITRSKFWTVTH